MNSTAISNPMDDSDEKAKAEIDLLLAQMNLMRREIHDHHERTERSRQRTLTTLENIKMQLGAMSHVAKTG